MQENFFSVTKCYTVELILLVKNQNNLKGNGERIHVIYIIQIVG